MERGRRSVLWSMTEKSSESEWASEKQNERECVRGKEEDGIKAERQKMEFKRD